MNNTGTVNIEVFGSDSVGLDVSNTKMVPVGVNAEKSPIITPQINNSGIVDIDFGTGHKCYRVLYKTTSEWNSLNIISSPGVIYIYSDRKPVPGVKIGDGTSYLIDLPFQDSTLFEHINNKIMHITKEEREKWNKSINVNVSDKNEELIFKENR